MSPTPFDCCRICTLIFNVEPIEIGRSSTDPTICTICEEAMYTIQLQRVTEMHAIIDVSETEIAALLADPTPLINDLRDLQRQWQAPSPDGVKVRKKNGAVKPVEKKSRLKKPKLSCTYCGALFLTPGRHRNHETKCIDNPNRSTTE